MILIKSLHLVNAANQFCKFIDVIHVNNYKSVVFVIIINNCQTVKPRVIHGFHITCFHILLNLVSLFGSKSEIPFSRP